MAGASASSGTERDRRFMAAAIRLSLKHQGLTSTNPSVGTLIVRDEAAGPVIVGRGVTARGGRPHAETEALAEAGDRARGAIAYVTLEPCAHHGRTPPCAEALVAAGVARVVGGASDPDVRVSGRGYAILREAGIEVVENVLADEAAQAMSAYLTRSFRKRAEVTLKLAISADGMIGKAGEGQVAITGPVARRHVHLMRAQSDVILVGIGTALADDPQLTVRLPGLENRSPIRVILDKDLRLPTTSALVRSARDVPVWVAANVHADQNRRMALEAAGVKILATEAFDGRIALPELIEDLAGQGVSSVMVEGGAATIEAFLADDLADRIVLFTGSGTIGDSGIPSPISAKAMPAGYRIAQQLSFGDDRCAEWIRTR